jgi:hypothetical protein
LRLLFLLLHFGLLRWLLTSDRIGNDRCDFVGLLFYCGLLGVSLPVEVARGAVNVESLILRDRPVGDLAVLGLIISSLDGRQLFGGTGFS